MNPAAVLALLADLYERVITLTAENDSLKQQLAALNQQEG